MKLGGMTWAMIFVATFCIAILAAVSSAQHQVACHKAQMAAIAASAVPLYCP